MRMTDRFGFITYKMYVLQGTSLFLLFNSFFPFFNNKNKHGGRERERVRERERERKRERESEEKEVGKKSNFRSLKF